VRLRFALASRQRFFSNLAVKQRRTFFRANEEFAKSAIKRVEGGRKALRRTFFRASEKSSQKSAVKSVKPQQGSEKNVLSSEFTKSAIKKKGGK